MRNLYAVLVGMMLAFALVAVGDSLAGMLFQMPKGLDPYDPATKDAFKAAMAQAPLSAMLVMVAGYFVAGMGGGYLARKLVRTPTMRPSIMVGVLLTAATIANFVMIPSPLVMVVLGVLAPVPGAFAGGRLGGVKTGDGRLKTGDG
ncbi:MAG: hypothetical protein IPP90_22515 [Gemmatimonadaceae bacterium]|nr:hypothetical protein [Gemmatimonadaceae bacterium]